MPITVTVRETEAPKPIPEGLYDAYVKEVDEDDGEFGAYIKITFVITSETQKDVMRTLIASKKLSKSKTGKASKLYGIVWTLTGKEPVKGESLDIESLVGKTCKILVKNDVEKDGILYQKITEVMPSES